jgi:hypothetical protein
MKGTLVKRLNAHAQAYVCIEGGSNGAATRNSRVQVASIVYQYFEIEKSRRYRLRAARSFKLVVSAAHSGGGGEKRKN